jgi:hypothetical protein
VFDPSGIELVGKVQQFSAPFFLLAPRFCGLQFTDHPVQTSPIFPIGIRTLRMNQLTHHRRTLAGIRQAPAQLIVINLQSCSQAVKLGLNGLKAAIKFRQGRRKGRRHTGSTHILVSVYGNPNTCGRLRQGGKCCHHGKNPCFVSQHRYAQMFNFPALARCRFDEPLFVIIVLLGSVGAMHSQCAPLQVDLSKLPSRDAPHEPLLPESGYLSNTTYTNSYFGFALDLPIAARGHLVKLPLTPERQHALLAIAYQDGNHSGSLTINAIEPAEGLEGFSAKQQKQQINVRPPGAQGPGAQTEWQTQPQVGPGGILIAPPPQSGIPEFQSPGERFHSTVRHKGEEYTALSWTQIKNYRVGIMVVTNEKDFLQKSREVVAAARFYCTADDGTLATKQGKLVTPEGERYEGPTVPTWRADAAIQKAPGLEIPPGEVSEGVYRNSTLGLQYELPQGWDVLPTRNGGNPPADLAGLREFQLLHACSRTLLRVEQRRAGDSAGDGRNPLILLRALDPTCLSIRTPASASDRIGAEEIGVSLEALSEFGQVASFDLISTSNRLFIVFHGTAAVPVDGKQLATRMSQTMLATSQNKLLLVWSFLAPSSAQLATMPAGGISFDGSEPLELQSTLAAKR